MLRRHFLLLAAVVMITAFYALGRQVSYRKRRCIVAVTAVMTLFSGLRSWWLGDLIKYYTQFLNCTGPDWREIVFEDFDNIGIRLFFHYGNAVGLSFEACLFLIAAFSAITLGVLIYRYSPSPYWSYLMYIAMGFYIFTFSGLKQTIAMGFLCLAMIGLMEGKLFQFLIWTLIAGAFHMPALIFAAAYPFARKKPDLLYLLILAALIAAIYFFRNRIVSLLTEMYYEDEEFFEESSAVGGRFLMMLFILALGYFLRPLRASDVKYGYVFNLMVLAAALQTFAVYSNNFSRLADYYFQFVVLFIPLMMQPASQRAYDLPVSQRPIFPSREMLTLLGVGISLFAVWYYKGYVEACYALLKDFKFIWEIDPYSLYGM